MAALRQASDEARRHVEQAEQVAAALRKGRLESQREAARRRPLLELGRFLVCMVDSAGNLNLDSEVGLQYRLIFMRHFLLRVLILWTFAAAFV